MLPEPRYPFDIAPLKQFLEFHDYDLKLAVFDEITLIYHIIVNYSFRDYKYDCLDIYLQYHNCSDNDKKDKSMTIYLHSMNSSCHFEYNLECKLHCFDDLLAKFEEIGVPKRHSNMKG